MRAIASGGDDVRVVAASIFRPSLAEVVLERDVRVFVLVTSVLSHPVSVQGSGVGELDVATIPSTHLAIWFEDFLIQHWWSPWTLNMWER